MTVQRLSRAVLLFALLFTSFSSFAASGGERVVLKISSGETIDLYHGSYALVIGNSSYHNGWAPLPGVIREVRDVAKALEYNGFDVTLKTDLTKDAFEEVVRGFWHNYGHNPEHRLLFYFAGHGYTREMATGEELGYLVMIDAPPPIADPLGLDLRSVDLLSLVTQAQLLKARHILYLFDASFSGSVLSLEDSIVAQIMTEEIKQPARQFIIAGRPGESVAGGSVFKKAFLELIEGRGVEPVRDGYITGTELALYLHNKVAESDSSLHLHYGTIRNPQLSGGDFVFLVKKPAEEPSAAEEETTPPEVEDSD